MSTTRLRACSLPLALAWAALPAAGQDAQAASPDSQPPNSQHVAFVGDLDTARTRAFLAFLRERFAGATAFARDRADLAALQRADVVLLDWPQGEAARAQRSRGGSPLGERQTWHTPTVLLGSAGLNLAGAWQVRGGFG